MWVYAFPAWVFFTLSVLAACAVAATGLLVFQRFVPPRDELSHNDVAGPIVGVFGTILAVAVAFLLVGNWQEYDAAAASVGQEASAAGDIFAMSTALPEPQRSAVRRDVQAYVDTLVNVEWPAMRHGGVSPQAKPLLKVLATDIAGWDPKTATAQNAQQASMTLLIQMMDARRTRLVTNDQGIPGYMWLTNWVLAILTIASCYLFRVRSRAVHFALILGLAAGIALVMCGTAELDYPFRGDMQLQPTPLVQLVDNGGITGSGSPTAQVRSLWLSAKSATR